MYHIHTNKVRFSKIINALTQICPEVAKDIATFYNCPLVDYIQNMYNETIMCESFHSKMCRDSLINIFSLQIPHNNRDNFRVEFVTNPIIQTAPHCQIYFDKTNFYTVLFSCIGSINNHLQFVTVLNASTITLSSKLKSGPAWLNMDNVDINILNIPNSQLSKKSVCSANEVNLSEDAIISAITKASVKEKKGLEYFMDSVRKINLEVNNSLSKKFMAINRELIKKLDDRNLIEPIMIQDTLISKVMIDILNKPNNIVYQLLFDKLRRQRLDNAISLISLQKGEFFVNGTYHFWGIRKHKIRKLCIKDGCLIEDNKVDGIKIKFDRCNIIKALQEQLIIPNLFWQFFLVSLAPQVKVVGGTRQIAYLSLFKETLSLALDDSISDERALKQEININKTNYWSAKLIESLDDPIKLITELDKCSLDKIHEIFKNTTLCDISKQLLSFHEHPKWSMLY